MEWRPIPGYEGLYIVSDFGAVKRIKSKVKNRSGYRTVRERELKQSVDKYGYIRVMLCKNGKAKNMQVHRLVAISFLSNPENFPCVNHKDCTTDNNRVSNLEWCSVAYNNRYGLRGLKAAIANKKPVEMVLPDGNLKRFDSATDAEKITGISASHISSCCSKTRKSAGGHIWQYPQI